MVGWLCLQLFFILFLLSLSSFFLFVGKKIFYLFILVTVVARKEGKTESRGT